MAAHPRSKTCGDKCRKAKSRGATAPPSETLEAETSPLVAATRARLAEVGLADSMIGRQALRLAEAMSEGDTGSGIATLSRELRATMAEALQDAVAAEDPLDELRLRRESRRNTG